MNTSANKFTVPVFLILTPMLCVATSLFLSFLTRAVVPFMALIPTLLAVLRPAACRQKVGAPSSQGVLNHV